MKTWRRATLAEPCGFCAKTIPAGAPELVFTLPSVTPGKTIKRVRCEDCAGEPVDEERLAIEDEAAESSRPRFEFHGVTRDLFDPKMAALPPKDR